MSLDHFLDEELNHYFSKQELEALSSLQRTRLKNIAHNYETMLYMGLPAIKPDFMKGRVHRETLIKLKEQRSLVPVSDSDSDDTWTPDMERTNRAKGKKISNKHKLQNDDAIERKIKRQRKIELFEKEVDEFRERKSTNFMHMEAPADDQFLYCEDCNKEYDMDCPVHGPLDYIRDTEVSTENDPERALHTLPPGLVVKESSIVGAGLGVFTEKEIPPRVMFGPYGGVKIYDEMMAHDSGYCWQIYTDGKPSHFVDAKEVAHSNWTRYINCAPSESEQNLVAFQFKGGIYYRSCKTISPGTELLCWYGNEYGRELGLVRDKNLLIRPKLVDGKDCYPCVFCKIAFTTAVYNIKHLVQTHGKDKLSQSDIQVLGEWLRTNEGEEYSKRRKHKTWKTHIDIYKQHISEQGKNDEQIKAVQNIAESESTITCNQRLTKELTKGLSTFRCDVCDYECNRRDNIETHMKIHTGDKCYKCDDCDYATNQRGHLKRHMRIHKGEKCFKCNVCDYASIESSTLKRHMRIHTRQKCFKCDFCDHACNDIGNLKRHIRIHTGEKCFKCDVCDFACNQSNTLKKHMRIHTGEKHFKCKVCDYECNQSGTLKKHMRIHTGEKRFKCDVCDYACNRSSVLNTHMTIHTGEKCFKCDDCDYASNQRSAMKRHMTIHTGEKCFKCHECDYASIESSTLKRHMRVHTRQKCFKCDFCDHACNDIGNLKRHIRIHTGEKCFKCDVCDYACNNSLSLKRHMRIHTGEKCFKCDVCDYACNQSNTLKRHMKNHTEEKCFECDVCDYASNESSALKRHMTIHTGEKHIRCSVCDYASNEKGNLKRHMRIHTGQNFF